MTEMQSSSDPKQVAEMREKAKSAEERADDDLRALIATAGGVRFLRALLVDCGVWRTSFHTNALQMAMLEGQRNIGLKLLAQVTRVVPDALAALRASDADVPSARARGPKKDQRKA